MDFCFVSLTTYTTIICRLIYLLQNPKTSDGVQPHWPLAVTRLGIYPPRFALHFVQDLKAIPIQ